MNTASQLRKSNDRGHANLGWLDSYHSFSFAEYYDPSHMNYSVLRVINEDVVAPAKGFGMHPHNNMEIITYMLGGELQHQDSLGNGSVIKAGDVQRMTAGTGIVHSEFNASKTQDAHLLQIWILPAQQGLTPSYEDKHFDAAQKQDRWCLIASPDGREGSLHVHQDMALYATILNQSASLDYDLSANRSAYLQVAKGQLLANGELLIAGDALMLDNSQNLHIEAVENAEMLLFDLPAHVPH
ncbi:MAG: quercetin 2,3-dioxygenase [Methylotenera sp.]|nr:MAG: quercetin 2,3-dioxygenase [Methylotenera sp.]